MPDKYFLIACRSRHTQDCQCRYIVRATGRHHAIARVGSELASLDKDLRITIDAQHLDYDVIKAVSPSPTAYLVAGAPIEKDEPSAETFAKLNENLRNANDKLVEQSNRLAKSDENARRWAADLAEEERQHAATKQRLANANNKIGDLRTRLEAIFACLSEH